MKIIATDFDGTLKRGKNITRSDRAALEEWRKAGNLFGVVTGRCIDDMLREMTVKYDFLICLNGAEIYLYPDKLIDISSADGGIIPEILRMADGGKKWAEVTYIHDKFYIDLGASGFERIKISHNKYTPRLPIEQAGRIKKFTQLAVLYMSPQDAAQRTDAINEKYDGHAVAFQNGNWINIVPSGVSKGNGIQRFIEKMSFEDAEVLAIGDNHNDHEMIVKYNGFAMANSVPEVLAAARKVYDDIAGLVYDFL